MPSSKDVLLQLVRLGIGTSKDVKISKDIDWESVEALAEKQGMLGNVYDGVIRIADPSTSSRQVNADIFPLTVKLRWMGKVMQRYVLYRKAVADFGAWYHAHGYRIMALKGLACGMNWPRPEHRSYGEIDIYFFWSIQGSGCLNGSRVQGSGVQSGQLASSPYGVSMVGIYGGEPL